MVYTLKRYIVLILLICALTLTVVADPIDEESIPTEVWKHDEPQLDGKYVEVEFDLGDGLGDLDVSVLCHHNLFSKEIRVKPAGTNDWDISTSIFLQPDGTYDGRWVPGLYDLWLLDGNGGQWEVRYNVEVKEGYRTIVRFIGHAVSGHGNTTATPKPTVIPTTVPTVSPTPTVVPTAVPTVTPTPTIRPPCHEEQIWHPGYWTTEKVWKCFDKGERLQLMCWCEWVDVEVWHEGYWETITVCPV